jgi:hypothetical protein
VKPFNASVKPLNANVKPLNASVKPFNANVKPSNASVKPSNANVKPFQIASRKDDTGNYAFILWGESGQLGKEKGSCWAPFL